MYSQEEINKLIIERGKALKKKCDQKADLIERNITNDLKNHFNSYPVDFIIETLTKFGKATNVVYDDNGMFAVSEECSQPVVSGKERIHTAMAVYVKGKMWKKTIRLALKYYLFS